MKTERLGIVMNGVTGRMGTNQHLVRSIAAIRAQGGVALSDGRRVIPDPILVGRNADKLEALAQAHGVARWSTDLDAALADPGDAVYFDSASTGLRPGLIRRAIAAGCWVAPLCDHVDLDGNLLLADDPCPGIGFVDGIQTPSDAPGLGVSVAGMETAA